MLESLHIRGYRSLRDIRLNLDRVTVITGENGVGKSNLYKALALLQRMAEGRFAETLAEEGGMPGVLWAGERKKDEAIRVSWDVELTDFRYTAECGLIPTAPGDPTAFRTDPDFKIETLRFGQAGGRVMAKRKGPMIELRVDSGKMEISPLPFHPTESMLTEVRDGARFPAVVAARETFIRWRFYHQFRSDPDSAMRRSQTGFWSPVLAHDGSNLAATLQTIQETEKGADLRAALEAAFPGTGLTCTEEESSKFQVRISRPKLKRPLEAGELSDGTLRFLCLCAVLLSPKPPPLLVINEPEASLHPALLPPLARLIESLPPETQVIVVTHARELAEEIVRGTGAKAIDLISFEGETRPKDGDSGGRAWTESGKRVWTFGG